MPIYEFHCNPCNKDFETLAAYDESGVYPSVKCPKCGSDDKKKWMSKPNFAFANPVGTDRWNSDGTGHDYRFKHNIPNVQAEREMAQRLSHMGTDPYQETGAWDDTASLDTGIHDVENEGGWL